MRHWVALVIILAVLAAAAPAVAASAWDPNDVSGPLDIRWISARFLSGDRFALTLSFYDDFRPTPSHTRLTPCTGAVWRWISTLLPCPASFVVATTGRSC